MFHPRYSLELRLTITEAARACGLTQRAIRLYEERGLISVRRGACGSRYYDTRLLERLRFIGGLRRAGLGLHEIAELLAVADQEGPEAQAERIVETCRTRLAELDRAKAELERLIRSATAG